jgi:hypothetical protein
VISKLTRLRLLAILCGPLLGIAAALISALSMGVVVSIIPVWIFTILLVTGLAVFFGAYDLLVITTCAIPALLYFGFIYAANVSMYLPDNGYTMHNIIGGIPPFDFADQFLFLLQALGCALGTAAAAIFLKRWLFPSESPATEPVFLWRSIAMDLGALALMVFVILGFTLRHQLRLGQPDTITATVESVLDSPTSTPADREGALFDMYEFSEKFGPDEVGRAVTMLRREVQIQPEPVNLAVAEMLLRFHDLSTLPLVEDALMHTSDKTKTPPPGGWESLAGELAMCRDIAAMPTLIQLMDSQDVAVRRAAASGLRDLRAPETIEPLLKGLDDPDAQIQHTCYYGLLEILDHHSSQYHWKFPGYDRTKDAQENYEANRATLKEWAKTWQASGNKP